MEQAKLLIKMDGLREKSATVLALTQSRLGEQRPDRCRVYEVNHELQVVALSIGSANGVRSGLIFWGGEKRDIQLRVVSVRPFVSAAVVTEGSLQNLAPGMTVYASREKGGEPEKVTGKNSQN